MLTEELKKTCVNLDAKDREFTKLNTPVKLLVISIVIVLIAFMFWIPEDKEISDYSFEGAIVGIYTLIAIIVSYFLSTKSKRYIVNGYSKNAVRTFRAYNSLEKYLKDGLTSHLDKAESNLDSLLINLRTIWGESTKNNPPFRSLTLPTKTLIENLENRIIPSLTNKDEKNIQKTQEALASLISFLLSENFNELFSLNEQFETFSDLSEEKESTIERIKQNKPFLTLLYIVLVIIGGLIISQSAKFIKSDFSLETQLILWMGISVPFTIWLLNKRYGK